MLGNWCRKCETLCWLKVERKPSIEAWIRLSWFHEKSYDDDFGTECEPVSLDFLWPPSHPEMLGRIGRYEIERMIDPSGPDQAANEHSNVFSVEFK